MKKRAQAAVEYLLVGAMVTLVILPTMYIFYAYSHTSNEEVKQSQINKVGTDIVDIAEQVYYLGEPSRVIIDAAMPEGIIGIEIWKNQEVVFFLNDGSEVAFKSKVPITTNQECDDERCFGNFTERFYSPGLKSIIIEAKRDRVFIREAGDDQTEQEPIEEDCECSSGLCCDGCDYMASGAQPTGYTDDTDGFCTGTEGATSTSYVYTRDYYCNGIDANEHYEDTLQDTCGICKYCTDNDLTCNYYSSSTQCNALQDCDYLNYYHITGTQSATSTSYCKYADYNDDYRYCDGAGSCSDLVCSIGSDTTTATAGTCKYISGCSGSTPGTVSNYAAGTSCGTNLECDGNGNCIGACECSSGPCCDGCYYKPAGTVCSTKDCDYLNYYYTSGTDSCTSTSYCKYRDYYDQTRYCDNSGNCGNPSCSSYQDYTKATCNTCKLMGSCSSSSQSCTNCVTGTSCGSCSWCVTGTCKTCRWVQYSTQTARFSGWSDYQYCNINSVGTTVYGTNGGSYSCSQSLPHQASTSIFYQQSTMGAFQCVCS